MERDILKVPLKSCELLTRSGGNKRTYLASFDLEGTNIQYEPGDVVGIYPQNDAKILDQLFKKLPFKSDDMVEGKSLFDILKTDYELEHFLEKALPEILLHLKKPHALTIEELKIMDVPQILPILDFQDITPAKFLSFLKPIKPRYYSIASSQKQHPNAVELIVVLVNYTHRTETKTGLTTGYLCERLAIGEKASIFFRKTHFRLPEDPNTDVIMIGPGTGLAPFKAFLEERYSTGAKGRNWLFFGDRYRAFDFLLEDTLTHYVSEGFLQHLDLAFSRDQEKKVYVQHKILEKGAELWSWVQNGAYLYVCGDAKAMAKDVESALRDVFHIHGQLADADQFIKNLKKDKRYQKDVY